MQAEENQLIEALPRAARKHFLARCEPVHLVLSQVLGEPGQITRHVYFPTQGYVSLIAEIDSAHGVEVGMAGLEGMVGVQVVLGVSREPLRALVQGAGLAWRLSTLALREEMAHSPALAQRLLRYAAVLMAQRAASAACMRFHEIAPRLARWLLMSQDRARAEHFPLTQVFVASMLGVRRVGVTVAAGELQRRGLIHYHRGDLTVLDRPGLEAAACSCYANDLKAYSQTMGAHR